MGQSPDGSTYTEEPSKYILVQGNADIVDRRVNPRLWTTQKTKTANIGDIIISVRAPVGSVGKTDYDVVLGRGVAGIKGNEFIYQTLVKKEMSDYWRIKSTGSTFDSINSNDIKGDIIEIPEGDEQIRIGKYFNHIDQLITHHKRKY